MFRETESKIPVPKDRAYRVGFLLINNFTLISLAAAVEPLRMANQLSGKELYEWFSISEDGEQVAASDGLNISVDMPMSDGVDLDAIIVVGGVNITRSYTQKELRWLQHMDRRHTLLGGVCTGPYVLAAAGLMDNVECSAHWECIASLHESFPKVRNTTRLFNISTDRMTSSGGIVPMDMMLALIRHQHGFELVAAIADMFVCDRVRSEEETQRIPLRHVLGGGQPKLVELVELMESNLEEPIELDDLASYVGISRRQLERQFKKYLGCSPSRYYMKLRLNKAKYLLKQTSMSVIEIASACGFVSTPHFSKCYRDYLGIPPRDERKGAVPDSSHAKASFDKHASVFNSDLLGKLRGSSSRGALNQAVAEPTFGSVHLNLR